MGALTAELKPVEATGDTRELVPTILRHCSGKTDIEIRSALVETVGRFLRASTAWRVALTEVPQSDETYTRKVFSLPIGATLFKVCEVRDAYGQRQPPPNHTIDGDVVYFDTAIADSSVVVAAVLPKRGDDHLPACILARWGNAICDGTLHELAAGGQAGVTRWGIEFKNAINEALWENQPQVNGVWRADSAAWRI